MRRRKLLKLEIVWMKSTTKNVGCCWQIKRSNKEQNSSSNWNNSHISNSYKQIYLTFCSTKETVSPDTENAKWKHSKPLWTFTTINQEEVTYKATPQHIQLHTACVRWKPSSLHECSIGSRFVSEQRQSQSVWRHNIVVSSDRLWV